jgi:hypothetical protein
MKISLCWSRRVALWSITLGLAACVGAPVDGEGDEAPPIGVVKERLFEPLARLSKVELPARALDQTGQLVKLNRAALSSGRIEIVTAAGQVFTAARRQTSSVVPDSQTWIGEIEGQLGSDLIITELRGVVSGVAHTSSRTFEIETDSKGRLIMFEVDPAQILPDDPEHEEGMLVADEGESPLATAAGPATIAAAATSTNVLDVLVVYTPKARDLYGRDGLESKILNTFAFGNQAFANSNVSAQLNLVHMAEFAYTETNSLETSLARVRSTTDGHMDGVHALRDQVGADVVALITEDADTTWCGYGYIMRTNSATFAKDAFSATRASCLANNTLPHEIGHNQGSHHDRETAAGAYGMYAFSYGYRRCVTDGTGFRTIMAYTCPGAPNRIAHYSNPNVFFNGFPTGIDHGVSTTTSADNARSMRGTAATVAAFRTAPSAPTEPPAAPTGINASATSSSTITLGWTDASNNESGFYVERSTNGTTFSQIAALGPNTKTYASTGLAAQTLHYFRVRAYNNVGASPYSAVVSATTHAPAPVSPPTRPSNVTGTVGSGQVTVAWVDRSSNEDLFELERAKKVGASWGAYAPVTTVARNVTSYVDVPGIGTWRYQVRAVNSGGASAWTASGIINAN